jgi:6-pyruvoyltetrahydropterin/6-carboxytetrahydropterin synthase
MRQVQVINFSCAHFYHQPLWTEQKNKTVFGKCFSKYGHGHDYKLEVYFTGESAPVKKSLQQLHDKLDHQHLNFMIPEFKTQVPTTENLAIYCLNQLHSSDIQDLRLYETPDLWVELSNL